MRPSARTWVPHVLPVLERPFPAHLFLFIGGCFVPRLRVSPSFLRVRELGACP